MKFKCICGSSLYSVESRSIRGSYAENISEPPHLNTYWHKMEETLEVIATCTKCKKTWISSGDNITYHFDVVKDLMKKDGVLE